MLLGERFDELLQLSQAHTHSQQKSLDKQVEERKRREEAKKKEQEAKERREKEMEKQRRERYFEQEKRIQERKEKEQRLREAKEKERERREEEQRNALRYGPAKAKAKQSTAGSSSSNGKGESGGGTKWPTSSSSAKDDVRRARAPNAAWGDGDDGSRSRMSRDAEPLTREEKRQRKQEAEMRRLSLPSKRPTAFPKRRAGGRLAGGAVDVLTGAGSASKDAQMSVRQRLAAAPNSLTRLNTNKRDTRTIDEIVKDLQKKKAPILEGEQASQFSDWFSSKKGSKATSVGSPAPGTSSSKSLSPAPAPRPAKSTPASSQAPSSTSSMSKKSLPKISKLSQSTVPKSRPTTADNFKKRPRKDEYQDDHERPRKRRATSLDSDDLDSDGYSDVEDDGGYSAGNVSSMIWGLFGKDKSKYLARDIVSDDEDMEVGASDQEREEKKSVRVGKREDALALAEEKAREAEKARRRQQKTARGHA